MAPDLLADRTIRTIDRLYPLWALVSLGLPTLTGWIYQGGPEGALQGLLWGGLVRIFLVDHIVWSVNSICHRFGTRDHETT